MNTRLYPWFKFLHSLIFWQAIWFLYFQNKLSGAEAILLYAIYDISSTLIEVPSGYMSDRLGRRLTLLGSALCGLGAMILLALGGDFYTFALAQVLLGASAAFLSGTDSALLFESLADEGREAEIEAQELRAWRFGFAGFAISAVLGGLMAQHSEISPFLASAVAMFGALIVTAMFNEPKMAEMVRADPNGNGVMASMKVAFGNPVLLWLFALSVLMYVFSHIPFVFGQPFILEALTASGLEANAPLVSGVITALMMVLSLAISLLALKFRRVLGLPALLLFAFGMQIFLSLILAATAQTIAIAFLLLRMVPDSLSKPFIIARIQPLLTADTRATYLSLQSLCGRIVFSASLYLASTSATDIGLLSHAEIQSILKWYVAAGVLCLAVLAATAFRIRIENQTDPAK